MTLQAGEFAWFPWDFTGDILADADGTATDGLETWVFIRNTGTTNGTTSTAAHVDIEITGDVAVGTLKTDEWCFFPFCGNGGSKGVQVQSTSGAIEVEYGYWSDSTAQ